MECTKKKLYINIMQLMASVFAMYFLAVTLGEPVTKIILTMNDKDVEKSISEQIIFWTGSVIFTGIWCFLWVSFKKSEKVCVEYWLSKR